VRNDRRRLIERARPFLDEGEAVAHVVRALEGPNRWGALAFAALLGFGVTIALRGIPIVGALVLGLVFTRLFARRVILATDRGLVVLGGGRFRFTPKVLLDRLGLETKIGPMTGMWLETHLNGRRLYIVPRCARDVVEADAEVDADDPDSSQ
jgi:hypothetical protein